MLAYLSFLCPILCPHAHQISLYNSEGEIIYSNEEDYIVWKATEGHPVYNFIMGQQDRLVENIRQDTINKKYYKFGYLKRSDNTFVQIGVLADNVHEFTSKFNIQSTIDEIMTRENVQQVVFVDKDLKVVSCSLSEYVGETIQDEDLRSHYLMAQSDASRTKFRDETIFHSCAPVFVQGEWLGTLTIIWSSNLINMEVRGIVVNGILELFLIKLVIGGVLYFAYRKNQSNIKIAYYDTLTGLPNAVYLDEYLNDKLHKSNNENIAVLLLNCRNFIMLYTTYGFKYGDRILNQIAECVRSIIPQNSMFFRFNADRFVIVIENYSNREEIVELAQKVMDVFKAPFDGYGQHKYVDAVIAIFEVHDHNVRVDKILQDATLSLNNIMSSTHGYIIFFDQNMEVDLKRKDKIESTIRAVRLGEDKESFYLEYQPKLDVNTNAICGFEALARLKIDTLGLVSPIEFMDLAEKRLLIYELGNILFV